MKPNTLPFVVVEWHDAWKASTDDATVENAGDSHNPVECCTAGWVLRENEKGIQLGGEFSPDGTHRNRSFIMKVMIVKVHRGADAVKMLGLSRTRTRGRKTKSEIPDVVAGG